MCESYGCTDSMLHKGHYVARIVPNLGARSRLPELDIYPAKMPGGRDGAPNGNQTARKRARYMSDKLYRITRLCNLTAMLLDTLKRDRVNACDTRPGWRQTAKTLPGDWRNRIWEQERKRCIFGPTAHEVLEILFHYEQKKGLKVVALTKKVYIGRSLTFTKRGS